MTKETIQRMQEDIKKMERDIESLEARISHLHETVTKLSEALAVLRTEFDPLNSLINKVVWIVLSSVIAALLYTKLK